MCITNIGLGYHGDTVQSNIEHFWKFIREVVHCASSLLGGMERLGALRLPQLMYGVLSGELSAKGIWIMWGKKTTFNGMVKVDELCQISGEPTHILAG